MTVDALQLKKQEVASKYMNDLKEELGFLKGNIIVGLFGAKLKSMMTSDAVLGTSLDTSTLNFREKLMVNISPSTAEKVFKFIKEKQEQIQKAKTIEELDALKAGILPTKTPVETTPAVVPGVVPTTEEEGTNETNTDKQQEIKEEKIKTEEQEKEEKNKGINKKIGFGTAGGLGLSVYAADKLYKLQQANKIKSTIDLKTPSQFAKRMQEQFTSLSEQLAKEAKLNPKLTTFQAKALSKSAKEFEKVAKELDGDSINAVEMLGKLNSKLPNSLLKSIDPKQADLLSKLPSETLEKIRLGKNIENISELKGINKEVIKVLQSADNLGEMKSMLYVLTKSKGVHAFFKGIKGIAFLDLISTGFDVRVLCEGLDEAESYRRLNALRAETKREHQWVQFSTSLVMTAVAIIGTFAAAGSVVPGLGTAVGVILGAGGFAASQIVDIYYDQVEFYQQNEEDFKRQYRTEIKQAIIQSAGAEKWNLNLIAKLEASAIKGGANRAERHLIPFGTILSKKGKLTTTEDGWKALIWQEEYKKPEYEMIQDGFNSGLSEEEFLKKISVDQKAKYEKQKTAINELINKRFEYIKLHMYENKGTKEYQGFVSAMKSGMGIKKIEQILADSKVYYEMGQTGTDQYITGATTIEDYKKKFGEKLKAEDPEKFTTLENIRKQNPYKFLEIYYGVETFEGIFENQKKEETDQTKVENIQKNIDMVKKFYAYKMLGLPIEEEHRLAISIRGVDNKKAQEMITTRNFDLVNSFTKENTIRYFTNRGILDRMETKTEVSDDVGQNIIYRIATEIHGYQGSNNMKALMDYFSSGKENANGLYYDDKWIINNDRAVDNSIDINTFESMSAEEIIKQRVKPHKVNYLFSLVDPVVTMAPGLAGMSGTSLFGFTDNASMIDTPTEGMDDQLNQEYRTRVKTIIYQEKVISTPAGKKVVEQKIVEYIAINAKDGGYIELPYYLIIAAKKAKIGNLQKYLFSYKKNQIIACTTKLYLTDKLDFSQTNTIITKEYVSGTAESIGENGQKYIEYVDTAKNQFEKLITYDVNELDIPEENMKNYKKKITERETLKQSMLTLDPVTAKKELEGRYEEFHDYFENIYIAMLSVISKFKTSNDLDSAQYHQQIENIATSISGITIKNGIITGDPVDQLTAMQKSLFTTSLTSQKIEGKTVLELAKSADTKDKSKAIRGAKQIMKSVLEAELLSINEQGTITNIRYSEDRQFLTLYKQRLTMRLEENITKSTFFDASLYGIEATPGDESKIKINTLTANQDEVVVKTNEVQKIIASTDASSIYPGRGLVSFDPEKNKLTSRGKSIEIESSTLKIRGLDIVFKDIQELIMAANMVNWFKKKYPGVKDFYFGSRLGFDKGIYREESGIDTQILDSDTIKEKFPSICTLENDVKDSFIAYINSVT